MKYDAVIVGAGHNGLAAAVRLVQKGWRVAVVEEKDEPGGAVKTRELTLPGFRHDLAAMNLSMFAGSPFFQAHKEALTAHGLGFRAGRGLLRQRVSATGPISASARRWRRPLARIAAVSPTDAAGLARDARTLRRATRRIIFALLGSPMPSRAAARRSGRPGASNGAAGVTKR